MDTSNVYSMLLSKKCIGVEDLVKKGVDRRYALELLLKTLEEHLNDVYAYFIYNEGTLVNVYLFIDFKCLYHKLASNGFIADIQYLIENNVYELNS